MTKSGFQVVGFDEAGSGFHALANKFDNAGNAIIDAADEDAKEVAEKVRDEARKRAPEDEDGPHPGKLKRSISVRKSSDGTYIVGTDVEYADFVEFGTRPAEIGSPLADLEPETRGSSGPYTIEPDEQDYLKFRGQDGEWVFRKEVSHPGIEAQPFMRPALDVNHDELEKEVRDSLRSIFGVYFDG